MLFTLNFFLVRSCNLNLKYEFGVDSLVGEGGGCIPEKGRCQRSIPRCTGMG